MPQAVAPMAGRLFLLLALVAALVAVSIVYARPLLGLEESSATPTAAPSPAAASPTRTAAAASPTPTASPSPTRSPTASCRPIPSGGRAGQGRRAIVDVRAGAQPSSDRVVFDFGTESGPGDELPAFTIERVESFTAISGKRVQLEGSAFWSVRFEGASQANSQGQLVYRGPQDIRPETTLVRQVRLVEDFEAVLIWGIGLARLECPTVQTLRSPLRLVLDFPAQ